MQLPGWGAASSAPPQHQPSAPAVPASEPSANAAPLAMPHVWPQPGGQRAFAWLSSHVPATATADMSAAASRPPCRPSFDRSSLHALGDRLLVLPAGWAGL
eukprot:274357-Chlamydomonas_euryale.AAC.7